MPAVHYSKLVALAQISRDAGRLAEAAGELHDRAARLIDELAPPMWAEEDREQFFDQLAIDGDAVNDDA
jgi:hypothetical protein